ncbi:hypothetical protein CANCADRAFT_58002 [Tortispora caseinolytica NRRL Y-17796]|uniref:Peptidase A1 domain-containing protein n=1 Tax=Tortispora caseinolytica NRRL Y-17796 TaxID=767744 RepID=A0A1E4TB05_9ASCO|nr:hypothetical protein CANCADRAFT_58002 [Tortispora caseinolytica NRRL Y-17796]
MPREATPSVIGTGHKSNLTKFKWSHFYTFITLGIPGQSFKVILDTGSSSFWVPGLRCGSKCMTRRRYISEMSSTSSVTNRTAEIHYGRGEIFGKIASDTLQIGSLIVPGTEFCAVSKLRDFSTKFFQFADGILGLGYESISGNGLPSMPIQAYQDGVINTPVMAFRMNRAASHNLEPGYFTIGGIEPKAYSGNITYMPVTKTRYWEVEMQGIKVGEKEIEMDALGAALDTGSEFIGLPSEIAYDIFERIDAYETLSGVFKVQCWKLDSLPNIQINLHGHAFELTPEDYIIKDKKACYSMIVPLDMPISMARMAVLGNAFLARYYSIFDFGAARVGLANINELKT